jgi:hypothetical protein
VFPRTLRRLRRDPSLVLVYHNTDDWRIEGMLHRLHWRFLRRTIREYHLHITSNLWNVEEFRRAGFARVVHMELAANPALRDPGAVPEAARAALGGPVGFIGHWEPVTERRILHLVRAGIPTKVYGGGWDDAAAGSELAGARPAPLVIGDEYARAIVSFDVNLGIVSKWNRNHTASRTFQIPALGAFLLHERNELVSEYFEEGVEAEFFDSTTSCSRSAVTTRASRRRARIAAAGRRAASNRATSSPTACARSCPALEDALAARAARASRRLAQHATIRAAAPPSQSGGGRRAARAPPHLAIGGEDPLGLLADEPVRAQLDRHGRSVFSRSVRHGTPRTVVSSWIPPESVSTIARVRHQLQEVEVADRIDERSAAAPRPRREPELLELRARARVHREDQRLSASDHLEHVEQLREHGGIVDVRRPVQREHGDSRPRRAPSVSSTRDCSARSRWRSSVSIITLPTRWTLSAAHAFVRRLSTPLCSVQKSRSLIASVSTRLISSASRGRSCAGRLDVDEPDPSFTATSPHAIVLFTSPTTAPRRAAARAPRARTRA